MDNSIVGGIAAFAIVVVIFLIFRAIVLWYWRVGEAIALLKSIDDSEISRLVRNVGQLQTNG